MEASFLKQAIEVVLGDRPPDLVIKGVRLLDLLVEEVREEVNILVFGDRIVYVGALEGELDAPYVLDLKGLYVCPAFIDPHCHLDFVFHVREYARWAVPRGTTTVITEIAMLANAGGAEAVKWFLEEINRTPFRAFFLCPSVVPPFPQFEKSAGFPFEAFKETVSEENCLGLGETYWPRVVLDKDLELLERFAETSKLKKRLEGHTAGAKGRRLQAYLCTGISSCHEPINAEEALELLRLGVAVMIRRGYIRNELKAMGGLKGLKDMRNLMLCTDLLDPKTIVEQGVQDLLIREAISLGFSPFDAIKMVSLNPALYYGLRDLGLIAPGRKADLVAFEDLNCPKVRLVIKDGKLIAENGRLLEPLPSHVSSQGVRGTFLLKEVKPSDFFIACSRPMARVRVIKLLNETITEEGFVSLQTRFGNIPADPSQDVLKAAQISRHSETPEMKVGFVKGFGLKEGALATSLTWDTNNIFVIGTDEEEMAFAVKVLLEHQGGFFAVRKGKVLASVPMPLWGIISPKSMEELAAEIKAFDEAARTLGASVSSSFVLLQTLPFSGLPYLRLTERGLVDIKRRQFVPVVEDA